MPHRLRLHAVGRAFNATGQGAPIVERETGTTWALQKDAAPAHTQLYGVSCPSAQACTAVGVNVPNGTPPVPTTTVAERWDGTSWPSRPSPRHPGHSARQ